MKATIGRSVGPRRRSAALLTLVLAAVPFLSSSCTTPENNLNLTVESYLSAVIQRYEDGIAYTWGPFRREIGDLKGDDLKKKLRVIAGRVQASQKLFDQAKVDGVIPPDPLSIATFRALGMGKGAASFPLSATIAEDGVTARVRTRVVTNLETLHLESLPDGVRIYLMGYPVGKLEMISVGFDDPKNHHLLGSVDVDWTLSRATEAATSPTGWLVESIDIDPNTSVEWKPRTTKG